MARSYGFCMVLHVDNMSDGAAVARMHEAVRVCYYRYAECCFAISESGWMAPVECTSDTG
jgi:hypothetical protein